MIKLRTEIEPMPLRQQISCRDGIFVSGSCFAENIGLWLKESYLNVCVNPFGVLYNPASIASAMDRCVSSINGLKDSRFSNADVVKGSDGLFYSFAHHGKFYAPSPELLLEQINATQSEAEQALSTAKHILVTFGTAWIYERNGEIVANCHKFPASCFSRRRLSIDEILALWQPLIEKINEGKSEEEQKHFVFTVSPIRHVRDNLHGNQISKATLLLAIEQLCLLFPNQVEYLPIYELLIDDLRDYRFYADDLVHPNTLAIEIIKDYFAANCLDLECQRYLKEVEPLVKALKHRPLHSDSESFSEFQIKTLQKLQLLRGNYNF